MTQPRVTGRGGGPFQAKIVAGADPEEAGKESKQAREERKRIKKAKGKLGKANGPRK